MEGQLASLQVGADQQAQRALWKLANAQRAGCVHDRRFHALVLLAAFASLRWGETAGRRIVGIPAVIIPHLQTHLATYVKDEPGALIFPNLSGG